MKKICFIITDAVSFNILCRGQLEYFKSSKEFDITLICGGSKEQIKVLKARNVGKVIKIPLVRQPSLFNDIKCLLILWYYLLINRFDVIVYSTPKALLIGSLASFFSFQPNRIALVRGRVYENYKGKKRIFFSFLDKISLAISDYALFISKSLKQVYNEENLVRESKSIILNQGSSNGVDIQKFLPIEAALGGKFKILVMGRICHDKGIYDLDKILKKVEFLPIEVKLIGKVEDAESQDQLNNMLKKYKFLEYIPFTTEPVSYFQQADLHIFLSHREGFGNVALEAASCNVPTFAYDVVGIKDSVKDNISGIRFKFQDTDSIAMAIYTAVQNPKDFREKFSKSRDWVVNNFEQKSVWQSYLQLYLDIAESKFNRD